LINISGAILILSSIVIISLATGLKNFKLGKFELIALASTAFFALANTNE